MKMMRTQIINSCGKEMLAFFYILFLLKLQNLSIFESCLLICTPFCDSHSLADFTSLRLSAIFPQLFNLFIYVLSYVIMFGIMNKLHSFKEEIASFNLTYIYIHDVLNIIGTKCCVNINDICRFCAIYLKYTRFSGLIIN